MKNILLCTLLAMAAMIVTASCSTERSPLTYFQNIDSIPQGIPTGDYNVKIEPSDELFITVTSAQPEATVNYNLPLVNPGNTTVIGQSTQSQQQTYVVDNKGDIIMPVLGTIHVEGMTIEQLQAYLRGRISADVEDPIVKVELLNFRVIVAGEVKEPGTYEVKTRRFSVLDALAAAGDLTEYAERNNVLVIREVGGKRTYERLNLNDAASLSSPYFYLKQNDYVYVEPNKIRKDNSKYNQNNAFKLSVTSTIVSGCSVIASLIIALCVK